MDIKKYLVDNIPPTIHYIPNYISKEEESYILDKVYSAPKPKWTSLSNRRLQDYGGTFHKNLLISQEIPEWLTKFMNRINHLNVLNGKVANHVLVNEYLPGQGIMPHTDGPAFTPVITTISCGSHTLLEFCNSEDRSKVCDILLEPRSLIIVQNDMYNKYLHSITEVKEDTVTGCCANLKLCDGDFEQGKVLQRSTRVSLTIRNVPIVKVWKWAIPK